MLESEATCDTLARSSGEWHCLPTTDLLPYDRGLLPEGIRRVLDADARRYAPRDPFRSCALKDAAQQPLSQEQTDCIEAINATPPWLRAVVRAEQHLAWAKIALPGQATEQQLLSYDIIMAIGRLFPKQRPVGFLPHLMAPHAVAWRSDRWLELCTERQEATDTVISMAPVLAAQVTATKKRYKRKERIAKVGDCCLESCVKIGVALLLLGMFGLQIWALVQVNAHDELCECQLDPGEDGACCPDATREACAGMRRHAIMNFAATASISLLNGLTYLVFHAVAAGTHKDHDRASAQADDLIKYWRPVGCLKFYASVALWIDMWHDATDACTEELIDGSRVFAFIPLLVWPILCCLCLGNTLWVCWTDVVKR